MTSRIADFFGQWFGARKEAQPMPATTHAPVAVTPAPACPPPEIFKAYDVRGVVDQTLTETGVEAIGRAIGSEARARGGQQVVIGRDGRLSGPRLAAALARGLNAAGCDVVDIGMVPTPVLYFATYHLGVPSGVMVTGSHNPPDYNGLKIVVAGETLSGERIQSLRERLLRDDLASGRGLTGRDDIREAYLRRITADVKPARPLRVVVDCGNGVAGELAPELIRRLGCAVETMYCEVDGHFPNHHPDPGQPKNLVELIARVRQGGVDLGVAFDGDGDRLGVIAPDGEIIWPDRQMILYARDILSRQPGATIIYDVKSSRLLARAIREAGGEPLMWRTGHSFIKSKLRETGAALAGEMSGHTFFKERWYGFDDGLYTCARLLELLARDARPVSQVFASLPNSINTPELNLKLREGEQHALVAELITQAEFPGAELATLDGLRADFPDGFGLVRASNTTPVLVFRFEGDSEAALHRIQDGFRTLLNRVRPDLTAPF